MTKYIDCSHEHHAPILEKVKAIMEKFVRDQGLKTTFTLDVIDIEVLRPRTLKDGTKVTDYKVSGRLSYDGRHIRFESEARYTAQWGMYIDTQFWLRIEGQREWGHLYPFRHRHSPANWGIGSWNNDRDEIVYQRNNVITDFEETLSTLTAA